MRIVLNGSDREVEEGTIVGDILDGSELTPDGKGIAIAVNAEIVTREEWKAHRLCPGDRVDIIKAVQGGS